jgi:hypothetical protein
MLEHKKYHEVLREEALASNNSREDLEVINGDKDEPLDDNKVGKTPSEEDVSSPLLQVSESDATSKGKGKGRAKVVADSTPRPDVSPPSMTTVERKRRRPPVDLFAGL